MDSKTDDELDEQGDDPTCGGSPASVEKRAARDDEGALEDEGRDAGASSESDSRADPLTRSWRRRVLVAGAGVLIVAGFATSGYLGWRLWQHSQVAKAATQAQTAAVTFAQVLTSIDSNDVDEDFDEVLDGSTGEFKDMYTQSSTQLRQLLIDNEASARGVVLESAVQSATREQVVVLLFVDQSVQNASVPDPRIDRSRIKMTMDYVDGRWRTSKVELP